MGTPYCNTFDFKCYECEYNGNCDEDEFCFYEDGKCYDEKGDFPGYTYESDTNRDVWSIDLGIFDSFNDAINECDQNSRCNYIAYNDGWWGYYLMEGTNAPDTYQHAWTWTKN